MLLQHLSSTPDGRVISQQTLENAVSLNEDARTTVNDLALKPILLNVVDDGVVLSPRLDPQCGDVEGLRLFENPESNLISALLFMFLAKI